MHDTDLNDGRDILDSRDIEARIDELEDIEADAVDQSDGLDQNELQELQELRAFRDEAQGSCDWAGGEAFIEESHFVEYAQQLAEDIGAVDPNACWPNDHIDWNAAAETLKVDYSTADMGDWTYYFRCT